MNIVIIDDSKTMLKMAENMILESEFDVNVIPFSESIKAIDYIENNDVDIVITDLIMPKIDGIGVLKIIKSNIKLTKIRVLMITSVTEVDILAECFKLGVSDYITKPFNGYEFLSRLKNSINEIKLLNKLEERVNELEVNHNKLIESNKKLQLTQAQLIQKEQMAGIGQLAAGVAHELNNPLGFVASNFVTLNEYSDIILMLLKKYEGFCNEDCNIEKAKNEIEEFKKQHDFQFIVDDIGELLSDTNSGLERAKNIVKSLKSFSRVDSLVEFSDYDINVGIKETLIIAKNEYKYICEIETSLGNIPKIRVNGGQINQVVLNLIMNSVHALKEKEKGSGVINIITYEEVDYVIIEIKDNGVGIDEKIISQIFNPFFTTKEVGEGTGLGLSISYDIIVNKHRGTIIVESEIEKGTKFIIKLPITR